MNRLNNHVKQIVSYDLITKFNYTNSFQIPSMTNITINMSSVDLAFEKKRIIPLLLVLELITGQKGCITLSKKNKIHLKIKKGMVVGCKVSLNKKNSYQFIENLITLVLPYVKNFKGYTFNHKSPSVISFTIENILNFPELQNEFLHFSNLPPINISINLNSSTIEESELFLSSFNFPIKK